VAGRKAISAQKKQVIAVRGAEPGARLRKLTAALAKAKASLQEAQVKFDASTKARLSALQEANAHLKKEIAERQRTEEALRQSELLYHSLVENLPQCIFRKDRSGRITYANSRMWQMLGRRPEDNLGKTDFDFYPPELAKKYQADDRQVMETGQTFETIEANRLPDGSEILVQVVKTPLRDSAGRIAGVQGIFWDVTAQKRAEEALRESEERFRQLWEATFEAIAIHDKGTIIEANTAFAEMFGYPASEAVGMNVLDLAAPESRELVRNNTLTGYAKPYEAKGLRKDGSLFVGELWGKPFMYRGREVRVTVIRDVTEQKRSEQALAAEEAALSTMLDNLPDSIFMKDRQSRFTLCSPKVARDLGAASAGAVIGKSDFDFMDRSVAAGHFAEEQEIMRSGLPVINKEETYIDQNTGQQGWYLSTKIPLRDAQQCVIGLLGLNREISARKRAEQERLALEAKVQQAQKLESLGVLAGGIAHDFNNLLMAVLGNAELALLELPANAPARERLAQIETASRRAADLCRQMLAYAGRGRFVVERIDLNRIIEEMGHLLEVSISKKVVLRYNFFSPLPPVEGDTAQLCQVIMNLITNASDAIGEHSGVISVSTGVLHCDREYLRGAPKAEEAGEGLYVFLEVSDTGSGIAEEIRDKIFDPFFSTKFTGRGLGLSAVLGIVRGHKGAIKLYSEPGSGTAFKVLLPAAAGELAPKLAEGTPATEFRATGTVLVVDDDDTVRTVAKEMLEKAGFRVLTASDGREAIAVFSSQPNEIACILLDLTMPYMDGEETFRELRCIRAAVPVILSSGYSEQEAVNRFAGKGLTGFIQKPYSYSTLLDALRHATSGR